jgi:hypothetical protein
MAMAAFDRRMSAARAEGARVAALYRGGSAVGFGNIGQHVASGGRECLSECDSLETIGTRAWKVVQDCFHTLNTRDKCAINL